jgi:hypothetical protein
MGGRKRESPGASREETGASKACLSRCLERRAYFFGVKLTHARTGWAGYLLGPLGQRMKTERSVRT